MFDVLAKTEFMIMHFGEEHSSKHLGKSREEVGLSSAFEEENDMQTSGMTSWRDCKSDTDESIGGM